MENLMEYLPLLIPVIILDLILIITALVHVLRHPNYKIGNKAIWIIVVLFISIIGPILYFTIGRGEE
ncbi:PLD nuclease N-terminal domain-containing protein [Clostridioides difficile]|uniref:Negative regulatory protein yxlE n=2 Tax=Clostridioides difficile TaxID=1496 RepID=A0AAX3H3X4_CLODI|nr:PLD nuclease N-terminal domain-containing protein [Clostridioides difficile]AVD36354.1 PLDc_N domain-containing protein [Clostridioides difficile]AVD40194.1 PLDc_N domain-containing protein [Clostridioides difficile]AVD43707.1 PLDc_N domain-containing protein [Clostridioides difficile]AXU66736.1 Negative regulatory protein YxlE [Clostridioides difficile]AXU88949.1 Negative regulatory protein YxlE [Clostridioides difficile]